MKSSIKKSNQKPWNLFIFLMFEPETITTRFAGWISGRIVSVQPDTDIQKLLSNGNRIRIRISKMFLSVFRGLRLFEKVAHCTKHWVIAELGSSELPKQRADFTVASAGAPLFFERNNRCGSELSHFTATAIRYIGVKDGQRKKFARAPPSAHVDSKYSSHCFALILDDLFALSQQH